MNKIAGLLLLLLWSPLPAAPGSWQSPLAELRLAVAGRFYHSEPATPPPMAAGDAIVRVGWRYRLPAGAAFRLGCARASSACPWAAPGAAIFWRRRHGGWSGRCGCVSACPPASAARSPWGRPG
ncbi:MAG: hypothetical protein VX935_07205 [Pseudomonadota bacterium]|nr:hypothetical protein [Pseudomonadota bacterium]